MFTTEDEWAAAYSAAQQQVRFLYETGQIECDPLRIPQLAQSVASAAIRNVLALESADDISTLRGVHVDRITIQRITAA